jgi:endonuclease/exonuclease/phosphatase family metal-dependent hydrolase
MRIVSYNIHRAVGASGRPDVRAIAEVCRGVAPDAVALNEVVRVPFLADQPDLLADMLGMRHVFGRTTWAHGMAYGNAALVRGTLAQAWNVPLGGVEPRALLLADAEVDGQRLTLGVTHLAPEPAERSAQLGELSACLADMQVGESHASPFVLAGDMNAEPSGLAPLSEFLELAPFQPTFPADAPRMAVDHVFFSRHWRCFDAFAVVSSASDHAALVVDLEPTGWPTPGRSSVY